MVDENQPKVDILGLFFGQYNTALSGGDAPGTDLVIKKDDLDQSSGNIVGRFAWENPGYNNIALVDHVYIDGNFSEDFGGSNVKPAGKAGIVDTVLFRWPDHAWANKLGAHKVTIVPGYHNAVLGSQHSFGVGFPSTVWFPAREFTVTLV